MRDLHRMKWFRKGSGVFNDVYFNQDATLILKIPKYSFSDDGVPASDQPERAVRLWNQLNFFLKPMAQVVETSFGTGWVCPYIHGEQASDNEIAGALIRIYNQFGRIVIDAFAPKNFVKEVSTGKIVCVDVGLALQLKNRMISRTSSYVSLTIWNKSKQDFKSKYNQIEDFDAELYPNTLAVCRSLIFLNQFMPEIHRADFLIDNLDLRSRLESAYKRRQPLNEQRLKNLKLEVQETVNAVDTTKFQEIEEEFNGQNSLSSSSSSSAASSLAQSKSIEDADTSTLSDEASSDDEGIQEKHIKELVVFPSSYYQFRHQFQNKSIGLEAIQQACITELNCFIKTSSDEDCVQQAMRLIEKIGQSNELSDTKSAINWALIHTSPKHKELIISMDQCLKIAEYKDLIEESPLLKDDLDGEVEPPFTSPRN